MFSTGSKPKSKRSLSAEEVAEQLDIHPKTLLSWVRGKGCPADGGGAKGKPYFFDLAEVAAWMKESDITGAVGRPGTASPDIEAARLRKENALAEKYEIQVAKEKGELVPIQDMRQWISEQFGVAKLRLIGIGAAVAPLMEGRDVAERQTLIDERINEVLTEIAAL